jgi:hypothetical protein
MSMTAAVLVAMTAPAFAWYQNELKHRDFMTDAALVFAYYEKCDAGQIPTDVRKRAEEKLNMAGSSAAATRLSPVPSRLSVRRWPCQFWADCTTNISEREFPTGTGCPRLP